MKNIVGTGSALERLKRIIPASVQPKFTTVKEWQDWQAAEGRKRAEEVERQNHQTRTVNILGRSQGFTVIAFQTTVKTTDSAGHSL